MAPSVHCFYPQGHKGELSTDKTIQNKLIICNNLLFLLSLLVEYIFITAPGQSLRLFTLCWFNILLVSERFNKRFY